MSAPPITTDSVLDAIKRGHDSLTALLHNLPVHSLSDKSRVMHMVLKLIDCGCIHCIDGVYFTDKHEALAALEESCRRNP